VIPAIADRSEDAPIRVWSAACASGQEAYSVAMLLAEALGEERFRSTVKIYATDVDDEALAAARHAWYPTKELAAVPDELRERCFDLTDSGGTFRPELRRAVIFGRHDLLQDPPISRIDLLVCRNTLMYFTGEAQTRVLRQFSFALRDTGHLFLGKSEVLLSRTALFEPVDLRHRVFRKVARSPVTNQETPPVAAESPQTPTPPEPAALIDAAFARAPLGQLVVNPAGSLVLANEYARRLFGLSPNDIGRPIQDLELSYRPVELRSRIDQVYETRRPVRIAGVEWHTNDRLTVLDVEVLPLTSRRGDLIGVTVAFDDVSAYRRLEEELRVSKRELETAYEELQSTVEELETTNEELQSTNEELETTNEELQSTNEELETMNEELQSTNEELEAINDELRQRTDELHRVNGFLESIMGGLESGIVVVDSELRIQVWNGRTEDLWGLRAEEVNHQPLLHLDIGLPVEKLKRPLLACMAGNEARQVLELPARNRRGREIVCAVTVSPLSGKDGRIAGAILVMDERAAAG
jgi:two-component system, chemotaxis family, CheB/CheR fusion protein